MVRWSSVLPWCLPATVGTTRFCAGQSSPTAPHLAGRDSRKRHSSSFGREYQLCSRCSSPGTDRGRYDNLLRCLMRRRRLSPRNSLGRRHSPSGTLPHAVERHVAIVRHEHVRHKPGVQPLDHRDSHVLNEYTSNASGHRNVLGSCTL